MKYVEYVSVNGFVSRGNRVINKIHGEYDNLLQRTINRDTVSVDTEAMNLELNYACNYYHIFLFFIQFQIQE